MKLYATNLCSETTESNLRDAFKAFGAVDACGLTNDKATGKPNNTGWVVMKDDKEAQSALRGLEGSKLGTMNIHVSEISPAPAAAATATP